MAMKMSDATTVLVPYLVERSPTNVAQVLEPGAQVRDQRSMPTSAV